MQEVLGAVQALGAGAVVAGHEVGADAVLQARVRVVPVVVHELVEAVDHLQQGDIKRVIGSTYVDAHA